MKAKRYRSKPVIKEAIQWDGSTDSAAEVCAWAEGRVERVFSAHGYLSALRVKTLEGDMLAEGGDYVIRGLHGEYYFCKPEIFCKSYDEVVE